MIAGLPRWLVATVLCLVWSCVSSLLIMLNNNLLRNGFPYPILLSSGGQLFTFLATLALWRSGAVQLGAPVTFQMWATKVLPIGLASATTLACGNQVYLHLSVAFIQMLKAGTPVVTMLTMFAFRLESPRRDLVLAVAVIAAGCAVAAWGEVAFDMLGFVLMMASEAAESLKLVCTQVLLVGAAGVSFTLWEGLVYITPAAFGWMQLAALFDEWPRLVASGDTAQLAARPGTFLLAASLGFCVNMLTLGIVKTTSSLTFKVVGQAKNVGVVVLGVVLLGNVVTGAQWVGYAGAIVGFGLYQRALASKGAKQAQGAKGDEENPPPRR